MIENLILGGVTIAVCLAIQCGFVAILLRMLIKL